MSENLSPSFIHIFYVVIMLTTLSACQSEGTVYDSLSQENISSNAATAETNSGNNPDNSTVIEGPENNDPITTNPDVSVPGPLPVNEAPVITNNPVSLLALIGQQYIYDANATDPTDLSSSLIFSLDNAPSGMTINPSTGEVQWTPTENQTGEQLTVVRVTDPSGLFDQKSLTILVSTIVIPTINESPALSNDPLSLTANVGEQYIYDADATDPNDASSSLIFTLDSGPAGMSIDSTQGIVSWTPTDGQVGDQGAIIRVTDPGGLFDRKYFVVTVTATTTPTVNEAPALTNDPLTLSANVGEQYIYDVDATDANDPSNSLIFSLEYGPIGMIIDSTNGLITWTPTDNQIGDQSAIVRVTDPGGLNDRKYFVVQVASSTNYLPRAQNDSTSTPKNTSVNINVLGNDTGLADRMITISILSGSTNGSAVVETNNTITYTPNTDYSGSDSFSYKILDKDNDMATATVSVQVTCSTCPKQLLSLAWQANPDQVDGYQIYFGTSSTTVDIFIRDTSTTSADFDIQADLSLQAGDEACFRLKAYSNANESSFSDPICTIL